MPEKTRSLGLKSCHRCSKAYRVGYRRQSVAEQKRTFPYLYSRTQRGIAADHGALWHRQLYQACPLDLRCSPVDSSHLCGFPIVPFLIENGADVLIKFPAHKKAVDLSLDRIRRFGSALKSVAIGTGAIIKTLLKERVHNSPDNERLSYYLHVAASAGDEERLQRWCSKKAWISTFKATIMVSLSRPNVRIHVPNPPSAQLARLGMSRCCRFLFPMVLI